MIFYQNNKRKYKTLGNEELRSDKWLSMRSDLDDIYTYEELKGASRDMYNAAIQDFGAAKTRTALAGIGAIGAGYLLYKGAKSLWNNISNFVNKILDKRAMRKNVTTVTFDNVGNESTVPLGLVVNAMKDITAVITFFAVTIPAIYGVKNKVGSIWTKFKLRGSNMVNMNNPPVIKDSMVRTIANNYIGYYNLYMNVVVSDTNHTIDEPLIVNIINNDIDNFENLHEVLLPNNMVNEWSYILINTLLKSPAVNLERAKNDLQYTADIINSLVATFIPFKSLITKNELKYFNVKGTFEKGEVFFIISLYEKLTYIWLSKANNGITYGMDVLEYERTKIEPIVEDILKYPMRIYANVESKYSNSGLYDISKSRFASVVKQHGGDVMEDFGASAIVKRTLGGIDFSKYNLPETELINVIKPLLQITSTIYVDSMKLRILNTPRVYEDIGALFI